MEENNLNKKNGNLVVIIVTVVLVIISFVCGYFLCSALNKKEETKCNAPVEIVEDQPVKATINPMDNIIVNLYGGGYIYYIVDGSLYYLEADYLEDGRYFLLTYSPCVKGEKSDYCNMNEIYKRNSVKVDGIVDVEKVRLLHRPGATDESFAPFAVDKAGNAYIIDKTTATKYYGNNNVDDIISDTAVLLKDGTTETIK